MANSDMVKGLLFYRNDRYQASILKFKSNQTSRKINKKHKIFPPLLYLLFILINLITTPANAVLLNDWIFNVDGTISENMSGDSLPASGTIDENGFGTLTLEISGAGSHNIIGFFDFEIDQSENTFYNEFAVMTGTPDIGQSWEVDEPGYVFGDIVDNVYNGTLDNTNAVPSGSENDVSLAMGWNFSLLPTDVAIITFTISEVLPNVGFYLTQADPDDPNRDYAFYFHSNLNIQTSGGPQGPPPTPVNPPPAPVPEPGTAILTFAGFLAMWAGKRRSVAHK
ncbi:MAG: PEP-CTERM sorting domain-containing protein [Desulfobacteraceae bacterium]|nr:PEP-CTERM sorting domain-containing protein [Desulfobacteraceae bacterium]